MAHTQMAESALADIETALEAIDGSSDYYHTVGTVTRNVADLPITSASDLPACVVVGMDSVQAAGLSETYSAQLYVGILGSVYHETDQEDSGAIETEREKFLSDVIIAVLADPRRGGYATDTRLVRVVIEEVDDVPMGVFWAVFGVWTDYRDDAP